MENNNNNFNDDFLSLLSKTLDDAQTTALKVKNNAVIAAGAGSGKTQVLATRFSWLIMTGQAKADTILTLTFTNKAASEMYQRIYKTLNFFANHKECPELSSDNIKFAKEAINNFSKAHIQTLDSYCGTIVRQCANRYGIKPDFSTGSSDGGKEIKDKAFQFVLRNKDNPGIVKFSEPGRLQEFSEKVFARTIEKYTSLATEENYFTNKLNIQRREIAEAWNYYALGYIDDTEFYFDKLNNNALSLKNSISELEDALNTSDKLNDKKKQEYITLVNKLIDKSYNIFNLEKITENDILNNSEKLRDSILKVEDFFDYVLVVASGKNKIQSVGTIVTKIKNKVSDFIQSILTYLKDYPEIYELNKLFDLFLEEINSSKRISGRLSFNDVTSLALKILMENEDIRNQEKNAFNKIMIDEFQDNNGKNRDLLYLLSLEKGEFENNGKCRIKTDENNSLISQIVIRNEYGEIIEDKRNPYKLFFVGDEKQSIYKFRGAEVSVFNELTKDKENELISMTYNYRSTPEVIKAFNVIFKGGNGIFEPPVEKADYEAYYEKEALKNGYELPALTKDNVPIEINLLNTNEINKDDTDYLPQKEQLAFFMANKIQELGNQNNKWEDIAILTRSRTDNYIITRYLSMLKIPYEVDQFNNIFEDGIVNDFYNFFRICVYPSDINAYAAYLTSPFCNLSITSTEIILSHIIEDAKEKETAFNPFVDADVDFNIKNDLLNDREFSKYIIGKKYFQNTRSDVLQQQITTTLSNLWHKKGYKYETLLSKQTQLCSEHFDMLFELGRQADFEGKNISWFVDQLAIIKNASIFDSADIDAKNIKYPLEKKDAVQIMTIHKSKGLQFKNVFVYGCVGVDSKSDKENIFFNEEFGVSIKPENEKQNYFYLRGKALSNLKELAEFRRLIYVAITRAISNVNIIGAWNPGSKSTSNMHLIEKAVNLFYSDTDNLDCSENSFFNKDAGFKYSEIVPKKYSELPDINKRTPISQIREKVLNKTKDVFYNSQCIKYKCKPILRKTPSSFEPENYIQEDSDTGNKYELAPDILINSFFSPEDFGTLVHAYLEAQANNILPDSFDPPIKLLKNLTDSQKEYCKNQCITMCNNFKKSLLGRQLEEAKRAKRFYRAEWNFRMMLDNFIFTGAIDLIYSNGDGTYTIVDYKSNNTMEPEKYRHQQECYRRAASKLLKTDENNIILYLFYLKHDKMVKL